MSKSRIEWTDETWNPVTGCTKVSTGCKNCYAEREWPRMTKLVPAYAGRDFTDVRTHADRLDKPLHWKRPRRVFVNSMSDLFHPDVPDSFIDRVFDVMEFSRTRSWRENTSGWHWNDDGHVFQILTKRPERMLDYVVRRLAKKKLYADKFDDCPTEAMRNSPAAIAARDDAASIHPYIWLGVSVENQDAADERIPLLLQTPAAVRWISAEPLLGPIDITNFLCKYPEDEDGAPYPGRIDWVVVGGESGPKARPMHPQWARSLRDQCAAAGVPFLFKQWGEWVPRSSCYHTFENGLSCSDIDPSATKWPCIRMTQSGGDGSRLEDVDGGCDAYMQRTGKKIAGRLLDGVQHDGYPCETKKTETEREQPYRVDCCADDCGWTGLSTDCMTFKHSSAPLLCPQCHEVVEPVHDDGSEGGRSASPATDS